MTSTTDKSPPPVASAVSSAAGANDQSAAARRERVAASRSFDGDTYTPGKPGHVRDSEGRVWFVFHDGSRRLVKDVPNWVLAADGVPTDAAIVRMGQGTSETEVREPVAASEVRAVADWAAWSFLVLLIVLGVLIGAFGHAALT